MVVTSEVEAAGARSSCLKLSFSYSLCSLDKPEWNALETGSRLAVVRRGSRLSRSSQDSCRQLPIPHLGIPPIRCANPSSLPLPPPPISRPPVGRVSSQPQHTTGHVHSRAQKTRVTFRSFTSPEILDFDLWRGQDFRSGTEIPPSCISPV